MKKINEFERFIGTGFYSGLIPFAPGTFGSLAALFIYLISGVTSPLILSALIIVFLLYGIKIAGKFELIYGNDPSICVIDEFVGMWISLLFIPITFISILIVFILWRFFDIIKPFPIKRIENLGGGLGIMLDDVIAGIYALISSYLLIKYLNLS